MKQTTLIMSLAGATLLAACAPRTIDDRPTAETAYLAARDAAIRKALQSDDRVTQINMQKLALDVALQFLAKHMNIDTRIDWDALARQGIHREDATTTINLFDATYADGLNATLWLLRPNSGSVRTKIFLGQLNILPLSDTPPAPETDAQKATDNHIAAALKEPFDPTEIRSKEQPADTLFYFFSFSKKISLIVDWDELAKNGIDRNTPLALTLDKPTTEEFLQALINALNPASNAIAFDIRNGMLRVSSRSRLAAESSHEK